MALKSNEKQNQPKDNKIVQENGPAENSSDIIDKGESQSVVNQTKVEVKAEDTKAEKKQGNADGEKQKEPKMPELEQLKAMLMNNGLQKQIAAVGDNTWLDKLLKEGLLRDGNNNKIDVELQNDEEREKIAKQINKQKRLVIADTAAKGFSVLKKTKGKDGKEKYEKKQIKTNTQEPPVRPLLILMFLAYCGFKIGAVERYYQAKQAYDSNPEAHKNSTDAYNKAMKAFKQDIENDKQRIKNEQKAKERADAESEKKKANEKEQYKKDLKDKLKQQQKLEKEKEKNSQKLGELNKQSDELRKHSEELKKQREAETDEAKKKKLDKQLAKLDKKQLGIAKKIAGVDMDEKLRAVQEQNLTTEIEQLRAATGDMEGQSVLQEHKITVNEPENKEKGKEKAENVQKEDVNKEDIKKENAEDNQIDSKDDDKLQENPELKSEIKQDKKNINESDAKGLDVPVEPEGEKAENKFSDKALGLDGKADVKLFDDADAPEEKAENKQEAKEEKDIDIDNIIPDKADVKEVLDNKAKEPQPVPQPKKELSPGMQNLLTVIEKKMDSLMQAGKAFNENSMVGIANKEALSAFRNVTDAINKNMKSDDVSELMKNAASALALSNDLTSKANRVVDSDKNPLTKPLEGKKFDDARKEILTGIRRFKEGPIDALGNKFNFNTMTDGFKSADSFKNLINHAREYQKYHPESMAEKGSIVFKKTLFKAPGSDKWEALPGKTPTEINHCLKSLMKEENKGIFKDVRKNGAEFKPNEQKQKQLGDNLNALLDNFINLTEKGKLKDEMLPFSEKEEKRYNFVKETADIAVKALKELNESGLPAEHDSAKSAMQTDKLLNAAAAVVTFFMAKDDKNDRAAEKCNFNAKILYKNMQRNPALNNLVKFGTEKLMGALLDGKFDGKKLGNMLSNEIDLCKKMGLPQFAQRCGSLFKDKGSDEWLPVNGASLKEINDSFMQLLGSGKGRETVKAIPSAPSVQQSVADNNLSKAV